MSFFLGIDGGGSKTSCVIGDENSVLGSGAAGGSNVVRVGEQQARQSLNEAIAQACTVANVSQQEIEWTCLGVAGGARSETQEILRRTLSTFGVGEIEIVGDNVIALEAAFGGGSGVIVISGTGSIAYGQNAEGTPARAGGWGYAVSDEGSAYWIGRSAVAASLRALDEGQDTTLVETLMKAWNVTTLEQWVLAANASPPPDFAALAPGVHAAADAGDRIAVTILTQAGTELARLTKIVIRRIFPNENTVPVAMAGGVFRNSALVRQVFYNSLRSDFSHAAVNTTAVEPVMGALELARKGHRAKGNS